MFAALWKLENFGKWAEKISDFFVWLPGLATLTRNDRLPGASDGGSMGQIQKISDSDFRNSPRFFALLNSYALP
jgi:hypothetical protein